MLFYTTLAQQRFKQPAYATLSKIHKFWKCDFGNIYFCVLFTTDSILIGVHSQ